MVLKKKIKIPYGLSELYIRTVVGSLGARGGALVARVARDTHDCEF